MEDTEATQLVPEALFDIRVAAHEIHDVVVWRDADGNGEEEEEADS